VLLHRMIWHVCTDNKFSWWCVRSQDQIWMVHRSMRNHLRVADELYIKRMLLLLQDVLFFSH